MPRQCPAAAYLSSLSGQGNRMAASSTINTDDLLSTRTCELRKAFLKDVVEFMFRCHEYVKTCKEEKNMKEFKMTDSDKKDNLRDILNLIEEKKEEEKSKAQVAPINILAYARAAKAGGKIRFNPPGHSSYVSGYAGQSQMTGSQASTIDNLMGSRGFPTPPRMFKDSQESSSFSMNFGAGSSSGKTSTDCGSSPDAARASHLATAGSSLGGASRSYGSYKSPYQRSMDRTSPYASPRAPTPPSYYPTPPSYQRSYAPPVMPENAVAQTSFYEDPRCSKYYDECDNDFMNTGFLEEGDVDYYNPDYYEEYLQNTDFTEYLSPSSQIVCACK